MILIIDDDSAIRSSLSFMLKRAKYEVQAVAGPREAIEIVRSVAPQLILMDMNFTLSTTGEEGLTLLKQVKIFRPDVPVILMTAWGSIQLAVQGMQAGAFDFITKPWNNVALMQRIETALELTADKQKPEAPVVDNDGFDRSHIIGKSKPLMDVLATIKRIARTNASVLITGESGTGKELIAEAVHINSSRAKKPFVKVNLGGISHTLFESEMFGHKKGAFTDATSDRMGRFELADKGTILSRMVREHTFREDLFYRINLITVHLPALRERREDIPLLVRYFADKQCEANGLPKVDFTVEAMEYLSRLPYPGNIRELKNLVERTLLVSGKQVLMSEDFKAQYQCPVEPKVTSNLQGMTLEEIERQTILQALEKYNNNMSQVATALGISRAALYRRLEKYNIMIND